MQRDRPAPCTPLLTVARNDAAAVIAANPRWGQTALTRLLSGFMSYEYRCATVDGDQVNKTLDEWTAAGWELHTASTVVVHAGTKETFYHSLYFLHMKGQ